MKYVWAGRLLLATVVAGVAVGCSEYLDRRDTIMLGTGEAVQHNIAMHVIDPSPRQAQNTDLVFAGQRFSQATRRVTCGTVNLLVPGTSISGFSANSNGSSSSGASVPGAQTVPNCISDLPVTNVPGAGLPGSGASLPGQNLAPTP